MNVSIESHDQFFDVYVPYNLSFVKAAREIEGKWIDNYWRVPKKWTNKLSKALKDNFFEDISYCRQRYDVELTIKRDLTNADSGVFIAGKEVSIAVRDSHMAACGKDVKYLEGRPTKKGGRSNFESEIKKDCKILLKDVSDLGLQGLDSIESQNIIKITKVLEFPCKAHLAEKIHEYSLKLASEIGIQNTIGYLNEICRHLKGEGADPFECLLSADYNIPKICVSQVKDG